MIRLPVRRGVERQLNQIMNFSQRVGHRDTVRANAFFLGHVLFLLLRRMMYAYVCIVHTAICVSTAYKETHDKKCRAINSGSGGT